MPRYEYHDLSAQYRRCVESKQPWRFPAQVWHVLGLCDANGRQHVREDGFPTLAKDRKAKPSDFNLRDLTEAMLGRDWPDRMGLNSSGSAFPVRRWLSEEAAAPIGPSFFANVAAWSATVGGLMRAQILEGYETAAFDVADLFPTRPAVFWQGGERFINVIGPSQPAPAVGPGESHPNARMDHLWVQPGPMKKYGHKILVAKETAWVDITGGQILQQAKDVGFGLKFRENELALDIICGQTNNFSLGLTADASATGYNTYAPTVNGTAIPNDIVNPMADPIGTFTYSDLQIANLIHPVTGNPINVDMNTVLLPTPLANYAKWLNGVYDLTQLNQPLGGGNSPWQGNTTAGFPTAAAKGDNPYKGMFTPVVSRWLHYRHTASTTSTDPNRSAGLGLTTTGIYRWYRVDPQRFAARRAAWEANTIDLNPNDFVMADQGIIAGTVGDIAVQYQVLSPWHIQRNKSA